MLTIGNKIPAFAGTAVTGTKISDGFTQINQNSYEGKWKVLFFYPKDFTFICPTEIIAFDELNEEFADRDTQLIGISTDSEFVHLAWKNSNPDLEKLSYPLYSDIKKDLASGLGVLNEEEGVAYRATFIVDPNNVIQHASINGLSVGRNPNEILRILDAAQSGELCPCNWNKGEETIDLDKIDAA
ncbi:MAG: peroxiredoxin [Rickettsiales bacterium]|nr:peroxiredoxin [Rickettsiales bacterium]